MHTQTIVAKLAVDSGKVLWIYWFFTSTIKPWKLFYSITQIERLNYMYDVHKTQNTEVSSVQGSAHSGCQWLGKPNTW